MIYYKVMSSNPVHGKSERSTVDLADQEVCLKYEAEAEIAKLRKALDCIRVNSYYCNSCSASMYAIDALEGEQMTTIYLLVVKQPPTEKNGCKDCQFEDDWRCSVLPGMHIGFESHVPEWCPLQKVEVRE